MVLTSVLPQVQEHGATPGSGLSMPPPNGGERGNSRGYEPSNSDMATRNMISTMAERLRAPWRREGVVGQRWEPGTPRPWRRAKRLDTADTLATTLPSTAESLSTMPSPGARPTSAVTTLPPATPRREAPEEGTLELEDISPGKTSETRPGFSPKCPPGCLDPSISRKVGPPFTRMPKQVYRHRRKLDPLFGGQQDALPSIGSDTSSPYNSLSPPRTRNIPSQLNWDASSAPDSHDELPSDVQSPGKSEGSPSVKTPRDDIIEPEDEVTSTTSRDARPPAMVNEAIAELSRPNAVWRPELWLDARTTVVESKGVAGLSSLFQCVRQSTERALQKKTYQIRTEVRHSMGIVDMRSKLSQVRKVHWFGRQNVDVPDALGELEGGGAGKAMPPPLIVCDESPLEVLDTLRKVLGPDRPIVLVTEVSDFDEAGAAQLERHRSMNPDCLPLRSDFHHFVDEAQVQLQSANATMRQHLCAQNDPYVFLCPGVTVFRGSRDEGFPFSPEPHKAHVVAASMPNLRPAIQTVNSREGGSVWYAYKSDHTALLERYNLVGLVGLQACGAGIGEVSEFGVHHQNEEELPVLVVTALGCGNQGKSPRDAVASILKSWRRRFAPFYHSVYICCAGRTASDPGLACYIDEIVNKSLYRINLLDSVAADMVASKAMRWHWDQRELKLSCSRNQMEKAAFLCRRIAEGKNGRMGRRMTPSNPMSINVTSTRGTISDPEARQASKGGESTYSATSVASEDTPRGGKADFTKQGSIFAEALAGPRSAMQRRETSAATLRQTRQDLGHELSNMLKSFDGPPAASPVGSRRNSIGSDGLDSSSSDEMPPENAMIGMQIREPEPPKNPTEPTAAELMSALNPMTSSNAGSRRTSRMIGALPGSRRTSRLDIAVDVRRTSRMIQTPGSKLQVDKHHPNRAPSPSSMSQTSSSMMTGLQLAGGLKNLCHQHMDRPRTPNLDDSHSAAGSSRGRKHRGSLMKRSATMKMKGEKDYKDGASESGIAEEGEDTQGDETPSRGHKTLAAGLGMGMSSMTEMEESDEGSSAPTSPLASEKSPRSNLPTVSETGRPSSTGNSSFGSDHPSPVPEEQESEDAANEDVKEARHASKASALSDCGSEGGGKPKVKRRASDPSVLDAAASGEPPKSADSAQVGQKRARRGSIDARKSALLNNRDLPEAVQLRGRRGSTGGIQEQMRRLSMDLLKIPPELRGADPDSPKRSELDKEERKDMYHKLMRRRSSLKGLAPSIGDAVGSNSSYGADIKVSTARGDGMKARRNSFSGFSTAPPAIVNNEVSAHEKARKEMRDRLMQRRDSHDNPASKAASSGVRAGTALQQNARRNSFDANQMKALRSRSSSKEKLASNKEPSKRAEPPRRASREARSNFEMNASPRAEAAHRTMAAQFAAEEALFNPGSKKSVVLNSVKVSMEDTKIASPETTTRRSSSKETAEVTPLKSKKMVEDSVNTLAQQMEATLGHFRQKSSTSGPSGGARWRSSLAEVDDVSDGKQAAFEQSFSARHAPHANPRGSLQDVKGAVKTSARSSVGGNSSHTRGSVGSASRGSVGPAVQAEADDASRQSVAEGKRVSERHHSNDHVHWNGGDELRHRLSEHRRRKKGDSLTLRMLATSSIRGAEVLADDDEEDPRTRKMAMGRRTSALQAGVIGGRNLHF